MRVSELTIELMKIDSTSGNEGRLAGFIADYLDEAGWKLDFQKVSDTQSNVIAYREPVPDIWFSTHLDTVPPFIYPTEDAENIYGRGACDAKGIIASQITAAESLWENEKLPVGLLFTVEEETSSAGAKMANTHPLAEFCRYLVNGEPTENKLAIGSKGTLRLKILAEGKAGHSAYPEFGESAIDKILEVLVDLKNTKLPSDPFFGDTTVNIGEISGGLALNVIAPKAEAGLAIRLTTPKKTIIEAIESIVRGRARLEILSCSEPIKLLPLDGFEQTVVRFTTDIPYLTNWGKPLLIGPGSILNAHTENEFISKQELSDAVMLYRKIALSLAEK
ncbi:MAG TPA: M20/M25/M40 family metallo-hydrolase [Pyrinomonadaceae bacterium]|nr:M20/M25/M40 family metallo-hydrolase [Pyrinomonadaceae bacterium]